MAGWIGVDLDGTLAEYHGWQGIEHVGEPIALMADRVRAWIAAGVEVKVFTARSACPEPERQIAVDAVQKWCRQHFGVALEVTHCKDFGMVELWDDRAVQVIANTGRRADGAAG